jgi:hypothetical protein
MALAPEGQRRQTRDRSVDVQVHIRPRVRDRGSAGRQQAAVDMAVGIGSSPRARIPYWHINGIKHLGNLVGSQLPADLFARYMRGRGHEVMFICATDEHGTPAELAAAKAGKPVDVYCAEMHQVQAGSPGFRLSFDHFGRSSSQRNHRLTQHFAGASWPTTA